MKVVVLGATGEVGRRFCRRAIDAGHVLTAYAGSRTTIEGVHELTASTLKLADAVATAAVLHGADAVVSTIGGSPAVLHEGMQAILAGARAQGVSRIVSVGGAGILQRDAHTLVRDAPGYPPGLRAISQGHLQSYTLLRASPLDWTVICPGTMHAGRSEGSYRHQGEWVLPALGSVRYDDVAHLALRCLEASMYLRARVSIASP